MPPSARPLLLFWTAVTPDPFGTPPSALSLSPNKTGSSRASNCSAASRPTRRSPNTLNGPPTSGAWNVGDFWRDQNRAEFVCTAAGTPGTWRRTAPATVTVDPASGSFPDGYLILNTNDGSLKRHAGSLSWEVQFGASTAAMIGFYGTTPTAQRANANQAAATDLASFITLANEPRAALVEKGLLKGGA